MYIFDLIRERISTQNPLLLLYHKAIAIAAALFYRFPARRMKIVAVTGTKGKSTTVHLIAKIFEAAGMKVGVAGTIQFQIGDHIFPNVTKQTTQGRFALQRWLSRMARAGCEVAVLEVTSHALVQSRLWGIPVDTAVLTNIQRDHLEYHGGLEPYIAAKARLFAMLGRGDRKGAHRAIPKTAVLPAEDPRLKDFEKFSADRKILYGLSKGQCRAEKISLKSDGAHFSLVVGVGVEPIHLHLPGEFNIRNALAAASAALSFGVSSAAIKKGLEKVESIPGRMEEIRFGLRDGSAAKNHPRVFVDYAHTPESLEAALQVCRELCKGKLFLVFGATGGGRDKSKRPEMGCVAARFADEIIVTDDDPYTEDRAGIIEQVAEGTGRREGEGLWKVLGRREAIALAFSRAKAHDFVLIAGKGCEPIQIIGNEKIPWDDREVARALLAVVKK